MDAGLETQTTESEAVPSEKTTDKESKNRYLREELDLLKKFQVFLKPNKK